MLQRRHFDRGPSEQERTCVAQPLPCAYCLRCSLAAPCGKTGGSYTATQPTAHPLLSLSLPLSPSLSLFCPLPITLLSSPSLSLSLPLSPSSALFCPLPRLAPVFGSAAKSFA